MYRSIVLGVLYLSSCSFGVDSTLVAQEKPNEQNDLAGSWMLNAERTIELLKPRQGERAAQIVGQIRGMKLQMNDNGEFRWTVGEKHLITGNWATITSEKGKNGLTGEIKLDPDNLPDHEIMKLHFEFLAQDVIKLDSPIGLGAIVLYRKQIASSGIYLVIRSTTNKKDLLPLIADEIAIEIRDGNAENQVFRYLTITDKASIKFRDNVEVATNKTNDSQTVVKVEFSDDSTKLLEKLSRDNLGREIVTIVDGNAISIQRIRTVVSDGKFQIMQARDDSWKSVLEQLSK